MDFPEWCFSSVAAEREFRQLFVLQRKLLAALGLRSVYTPTGLV